MPELHQILDLLPSAIKSYQRAIDALPKESLSPAEQNQKKQYKAALDAVTLKKQNAEAARNVPLQRPTAEQPYIKMNNRDKNLKMPWIVAEEMIPKLRAKEDYFSSVRTMFMSERARVVALYT